MRPPVDSRSEGRRPVPEDASGHSGGARRDPRHQTTVAPIAASDRPSGPKMRTDERRGRRRRPGRRKHPGTSGARATPARPRDRPGWDAGSGPRQRGGGPDPALPGAGRHPGTCPPSGPGRFSGRQCVPAGAGGPVTGTLPRPADPATAPSAPRPPALAHPPRRRRRTRPRPRLPGLRPVRARRARPRRAGARRPRPAVPLRPLARPRLRPGLLRAAALLDRHLRRLRSRGWPWRCSRRRTSRCSAAPPR